MASIVSFQLGKRKLTKEFIESLEKTFKKHDLVKINILKSCSRNKQEVKEMAEKICHELNKSLKKDFTYKKVGYNLFVKKWRRRMK
jgi:RNA-binding protein YhbY